MTWPDLDWKILDRLRDRFLGSAPFAGPYWQGPDDLAHYDFTFGERIGWKWDQVLRELTLRGWRPPSRLLFDWGCGSGVASRRWLAQFGADHFDTLVVWDHSPLASDFAAEAAQRAFPSLRVVQATPGFLAGDAPLGTVVLSHVLNELPPEALAALLRLLARAEAVVWVEPGTHAISRKLGALREELRTVFSVVAPCTRADACPMFSPGNERHWCHFFAPPPAEVFADSNWVKFGQRAGVDLRSLPYCFLALDRRPTPALPPEFSRVIGRVEHFKPYARFLDCAASGLAELEVPKRADLALYKELERTKAPLIYRWRREGAKILGGEAFTRGG